MDWARLVIFCVENRSGAGHCFEFAPEQRTQDISCVCRPTQLESCAHVAMLTMSMSLGKYFKALHFIRLMWIIYPTPILWSSTWGTTGFGRHECLGCQNTTLFIIRSKFSICVGSEVAAACTLYSEKVAQWQHFTLCLNSKSNSSVLLYANEVQHAIIERLVCCEFCIINCVFCLRVWASGEHECRRSTLWV